MRVLALATYPVEAASSRYRVVQFIEPLAKRGIRVTFSPFLDARLFEALYQPRKLLLQLPRLLWRVVRRLGDLVRAARADVVWIQREAMLFGPPVVEWFIARVLRRPIVLDLDDATYVAYVSPVYGRVATLLKWPSKTDALIRWATAVVAGSAEVARYAGTEHVLPTIVDLSVFTPGTPPSSAAEPAASRRRERDALGSAGADAGVPSDTPVIGWIGTHGTFPYLERILPLLARIEEPFELRVIGSGRIDAKPWRMEEEVDDLRSFDIGLYPITEDRWSVGKSGFKAVQYMAIGIPFVMSPVGVCTTMGLPGRTHLLARSDSEWVEHLTRLLRDPELRRTMGRAGRAYAEEHYAFERHVDALVQMLPCRQ